MRRPLFTCLTFSCCAVLAQGRGADLPEKYQIDIEKTKSDYEEARKLADKKLLEAFDAEIEVIRKQPGLKAEAKQEAIEAVKVERDTFEKHGTIPFSPRMRAAAMSRISGPRQSARALAVAYDKAVEHLTKAKDDSAAKAKIAEKKMILKPKLAGTIVFSTTDNRTLHTATLFADGTSASDEATWSLNKDALVITIRGPGSPPGGWIDTCTFHKHGQTCVAKNQRNFTFNGKRIDAAKE